MEVEVEDLNSTQDLLEDTLPIVDSVVQDDSEEEVFFGNISSKEKNGKNAKFNRRRTIGMKECDRRRSFEVTKSTSKIKSENPRSSLHGSQKSIAEEEGFDDGFTTTEHGAGRFGQSEGASTNLACGNLGDAMDGNANVEDGSDTDSQNEKRIHQSLAHEGFRSNKDFGSSTFDSNHSFVMEKEREKDDAKWSKNEKVLLENNLDGSPLGNADSTNVFSEVSHLDLPQPALEESFSIELKVRDDSPIMEAKSVNNDEDGEDSQNAIKNERSTRESFSADHSFKSDARNSSEHNISPADSPKDVIFPDDSPDKLPHPMVQKDVSTDEPECISQDSFFSNLTSNNTSGFLHNIAINSISGIELLNVGCPTSSVKGSIQSDFYVSALERSQVSSEDGTGTPLDATHPPTSSIFTKSPTSEEGQNVVGDKTKLPSLNESWRESQHQDDQTKINVSEENLSAFLLETSLEKGETQSSKHLANLQDRALISKVEMNEEANYKNAEPEDKDLAKCYLEGIELNFEKSELEHVESDDDINPLEDILDVENDQLFDDSLYSSGDNTSRRLSTISNKICQKWKKKEIKAKKNVDTSNNENTNSSEDGFCSVLGSLHSSRNSSIQETQEEFDNTADEMALYEMFGEHYDKIVEEMTGGEKKKLRKKLDNRTEEDNLQTEENLKQKLAISSSPSPPVSPKCKVTLIHSPSKNDNSGFAVSPSLPNSNSSDFNTSTSRHSGTTDNILLSGDQTPLVSESLNCQSDIQTQQDYRYESKSPDRSYSSDSLFKSPTSFRQATSPARSISSESLFKSPTYLQPTTASLYKRVTRSPSPSKPIPWRPVSPHCNKSFIPVPVHSGTPARVPNSTPTRTPIHGGTSTVTPLKATPLLSGAQKRTPASSAKSKFGPARAIVSPSPLGTYLRDNKPPPLIHQVKAQSAARDLESTLMEVENEAPETGCSLPEARYYAPTLAKEHLSDATNKDYNIAEAYGQTNTLAKVTRHVGRIKLAGVRWEEELATDQSLMRSPVRGQLGIMGKSVLKKTQRDSGTWDESMADMSVLETVAIKKIGRKDKKGN